MDIVEDLCKGELSVFDDEEGRNKKIETLQSLIKLEKEPKRMRKLK